MKYVITYIVFAVFLTFFSYVYKPFIGLANKYVIKNVVFISYPVTSVLDSVKEFSDKYLVLIDVKKENAALRKKIVQLKIRNNMLKNSNCQKPSLNINRNVFKAKFKFKNNFNIDFIFLYVDGKLDLSSNNCSVFTNKMNLVGFIYKKEKNFYVAKTVFNHSFVADSYIVSDNETYRALFIGDLYRPQAEYLTPNADIKPGSYVYTSGAFGVFPKGSFIGKVKNVSNVNNYYKVAYVSIDKNFFNDWNLFVICIRKH